MTVEHLEVLVEEASMEAALRILLPEIKNEIVRRRRALAGRQPSGD
jgi:hypothetical protein